MTNVLEMAARRRARFQREIDRLDAFIAMGEQIVRTEGGKANPAAPRPAPPYPQDVLRPTPPHVVR